MLHMVATLVSLILLIGTAGLIAASLDERRAAILAALRRETVPEVVPAVRGRPRVRWSGVRTQAAPQGARLAA